MPAQQNPPSSPRRPGVNQRSLWQSYQGLSRQTRLAVSLSMFTLAGAGLLVADYLERQFPAENAKPDIKQSH